MVIMQVLNSLQVGREDGLLVGQTVAPVRRVEQEVGVQRNHWYVESWLNRMQQGEDVGGGEKKREEQDGDIEVRMARELHDLRINRLNNFTKSTDSLLADQQQQNFELRQNGLQGTQQQLHENKYSWQVSHIMKSLSIENREEALALENKLREQLDNWYDTYGTQEQNGLKNLGQKRDGEEEDDYEEDYEEDYSEDYEEEEEEEEEVKRRVFDPEDFDIRVAEDGKVTVTRKQLEPEVLVENITKPSTEIEEWKIMLTLRSDMLCVVSTLFIEQIPNYEGYPYRVIIHVHSNGK